jgi:hypothetical protein
MQDLTIRPSRVWYWIAGVLLAGAVACVPFAIMGFSSLGHQIATFQRVKVPGEGFITISGTGRYLLFFEGPGMNRVARTGTVRVELQLARDGTQVHISRLQGESERYNLSGHSGQAVASVTIKQPGKYVLTNGVPSEPAPADIAIGRGITSSLLLPLLLILVAAIVLTPAGILTWVFTAVRRGRSRRRIQAGVAQPFPAYPIPPFGAQPPGGPLQPPGGPLPPAGGPSVPPY